MLNKFEEEDLAWLLKGMLSEISDEDLTDLANDYARRINIFLESHNLPDVMTVEEFAKDVEYEYFTDYDGNGWFVDDTTLKETKQIRCNKEWLLRNKPENCTYINWYNR